ncbi:MAG: hypothetical protein R3B54_00225 [Bdellovibrionota bacterium]
MRISGSFEVWPGRTAIENALLYSNIEKPEGFVKAAVQVIEQRDIHAVCL